MIFRGGSSFAEESADPSTLSSSSRWRDAPRTGQAPGRSSGKPLQKTRPQLLAVAATLASLGVACAAPVGVKRIDARTLHRDLTSNVVSTGEPSHESRWVLNRLDLTDAYEEHPVETLAALHTALERSRDQELLFALAELSFDYGDQSGDHAYFLAAAVYAYGFLFPEGRDPPDPLDGRLRVAALLYNRGLTRGLARQDAFEVTLAAGRYPLPFGTLEIRVDPQEYLWAGRRLELFVPVAELRVTGLRNLHRRAGIGAPLAAQLAPAPERGITASEARVPADVRVAVTAFLRFDDLLGNVRSGLVRGQLEIHPFDEGESIEVAGRRVPLEMERTSSLAYMLSESRPWESDLASFFLGDLVRSDERDGLELMAPHRGERIPLVLVHGTVSSPATWAETVNDLLGDPFVRRHYEIWLFVYNTGNPIAYSASLLREALRTTVKILDPEGSNPMLEKMVLVGHSQGGLLVRMMVSDSGDRFWAQVSDVPLDELDLRPETRDILRAAFFFEALPFVERVVFMATPHRGSYLAGWGIAELVKRTVRFPLRLAGVMTELLQQDRGDVALRNASRIPSSVDNMDPNHPFIRTLADAPLADGVKAHSIIGALGEGPLEERGDGVVEYESAHLEGVESELVIQHHHSLHGTPAAIAELVRILRLNAGEGR